MDKTTVYKFSEEESLNIIESLQYIIERDMYNSSDKGIIEVNEIIRDHTDYFFGLFKSDFEITIKTTRKEEEE